MKQKAFFKYKISKILDEIILIIVAIMFLFPLLWMLCASFYDTTQASQYPPRLFPDPISLRKLKKLIRIAGAYMMQYIMKKKFLF